MIFYSSMTMEQKENDIYLNSLFNNQKIIVANEVSKDSISDQLLTIRCLVLVPAPLSETEQAQLAKILTACRLAPSDYHICEHPISWSSYRGFYNIQEVLLFGTGPGALALDLAAPLNRPFSFDGRLWCQSQAVSLLMSDQASKNELWTLALKPMFGIR